MASATAQSDIAERETKSTFVQQSSESQTLISVIAIDHSLITMQAQHFLSSVPCRSRHQQKRFGTNRTPQARGTFSQASRSWRASIDGLLHRTKTKSGRKVSTRSAFPGEHTVVIVVSSHPAATNKLNKLI